MATKKVEPNEILTKLTSDIAALKEAVEQKYIEMEEAVKYEANRKIQLTKAEAENSLAVLDLELATEKRNRKAKVDEEIKRESVILEELKKEKGSINDLTAIKEGLEKRLQELEKDIVFGKESIVKVYAEKTRVEKDFASDKKIFEAKEANYQQRIAELTNALTKANDQIVELQKSLTSIASGLSAKDAVEQIKSQIQLLAKK